MTLPLVPADGFVETYAGGIEGDRAVMDDFRLRCTGLSVVEAVTTQPAYGIS